MHMRIALLWTHLSGYLNACLKELASRSGVELFVSHLRSDSSAPFNDQQFEWITNRFVLRSKDDNVALDAALEQFQPDILLFSSWYRESYRRAALKFARRSWRVMTMDNCWEATLKQWGGTIIAPWYVRPLADAVLLPGERQAMFARKLGFKQRNILCGALSCDQPKIEEVHLHRIAEHRPVPRSFLFIGRFVSDKGIDQLVRAYQIYRQRSLAPWPLVCCGTGPLLSLLQNQPGIQIEGFVQPDQLGSRLASAGCLVLPSTFEPWGVVVHEAASAGLLILASRSVGAVVNLVQPNFNGYIFDPRDAEELARLMSHVSCMNEERLEAMSRASNLLSRQFSPSLWADNLMDGYDRLWRPLSQSSTQRPMKISGKQAGMSDFGRDRDPAGQSITRSEL